jgi:hypothetical protein
MYKNNMSNNRFYTQALPTNAIEWDNLPIYNHEEEVHDSEIHLIEPSFETFATSTFAQNLLKVASSYLGVSRQSNLPQVAKFLDLFGLKTKIGDSWVPFCASGLSYAACKTYCNMNNIAYDEENALSVFKSVKPKVQTNYFLPSPSCGFIMQDAQKRKTWMEVPDNKSDIKPGFLVLYSWSGGSWPDHIGIVETASDLSLHTIEFNTSGTDNRNGGCVNRRIRTYDYVLGFVRIV